MARLPTAVARRAADSLGMSVDAVQNAARRMDESTAVKVFAATAADQPARVTSAAGGTVRKSALFVGGGAGALGGAWAVDSWSDAKEAAQQAQTQQEKVALAREIASSPNLGDSEKESLIGDMFDKGIITGSGGGGVLGGLEFPSPFSMKGILLILVVVYLGRTVARRAD